MGYEKEDQSNTIIVDHIAISNTCDYDFWKKTPYVSTDEQNSLVDRFG